MGEYSDKIWGFSNYLPSRFLKSPNINLPNQTLLAPSITLRRNVSCEYPDSCIPSIHNIQPPLPPPPLINPHIHCPNNSPEPSPFPQPTTSHHPRSLENTHFLSFPLLSPLSKSPPPLFFSRTTEKGGHAERKRRAYCTPLLHLTPPPPHLHTKQSPQPTLHAPKAPRDPLQKKKGGGPTSTPSLSSQFPRECFSALVIRSRVCGLPVCSRARTGTTNPPPTFLFWWGGEGGGEGGRGG